MVKEYKSQFSQLSLLKKILVIILLIILSISVFLFLMYKKNEYLVNPNNKLYKQFEWTTWEDSAGGRMAHDPKWLAMVPDKYIPKEVPFKFSFKEKYFTPAHERRRKYFNHLCETERISYRVEDYPEHMKNSRYNLEESSFIYTNRGELPVKGMKQLYDIAESENSTKKEKEDAKSQIRKIWTIYQQNPYYYSIRLGAIPILKEGKIYDLMLVEVNADYYEKNKTFPLKNTFREYLDNEGYVWRVRYDSKSKQFLPIEKDTTIQAQYYILTKKEQNKTMRKLGIWKVNNMTIDIINQRVMSYTKTFIMPSYLSSLRGTTFQLPIDWNEMVFCPDNTINRFTIKNFN